MYREGLILRTVGTSTTLHTHTGSTTESTEEKRLGYSRAVRGRTRKVMKKKANAKSSQRGQPRPLRAESQSQEDWEEAKT